jgi:hypothetical protein
MNPRRYYFGSKYLPERNAAYLWYRSIIIDSMSTPGPFRSCGERGSGALSGRTLKIVCG